ncbi:MAG: ZIP family metal transporter [Anaerolineales bacterium]|nr:ZIP family metal transporter [Anaerolineales bacterium]
MELHVILNAALLSLVAGLGTGLGGLIAILRRPGRRAFGFLMGMTAGVMISLAFMELVAEAWALQGFLTATVGFAAGAFAMFGLDIMLPHMRFGEIETSAPSRDCGDPSGPPSGQAAAPDSDDGSPAFSVRGRGRGWRRGRHFRPRLGVPASEADPGLLKTGALLAIGITVHNIPEGIAVGAGYVHLPAFGVFIALAILLHNIPEGIATALPLCQGGLHRWDALRVSVLSGLAEPVGALAAALFLKSFEVLIPGALAFAGGVMMFITLDELIPAAREYGHQHFVALGIIIGSIFVFLLSGLLGV